MATYLRDGFRGTCTSPASGTGPYTGIVAVAGYRSFATLTDGDLVLVGVRSATTWGEAGVFTKSGGSTPTLSRTRVDITVNGNSSPYDWPPGTPLVIYSTLDGADTASLLGANTWQADQSFNGKRLRLSPDSNTYIDSQTNGTIELVVANAAHTYLAKGGSGENYLQVQWADNGALPGPMLQMDRHSTSPAINHFLGALQFSGRNSTGAFKVYGTITSRIRDPSGGSEDAAFDVQVLRAGNMIPAFELNDHNAIFFPTFQDAASGLMIGKNSGVFNDVGVEVRSDGSIAASAQNQSCLYLNRTSSDGTVISVYRDGTVQGGLQVIGGVVSVLGGGFSHNTELPQDQEDPPEGTVMCAIAQMLDDGLHPMTAPSSKASDSTVYGVWAGRDEHGAGLVAASGSGRIRVMGPVEPGDLLESSRHKGLARAQVGRQVLSSTIAKAWGSAQDGQEALIPCTLAG